jgi:hypothetical protein
MVVGFYHLSGLVHEFVEPMEHVNKKGHMFIRMEREFLAERFYCLLISPPALLADLFPGFGQFYKDLLVVRGLLISPDDSLGLELFHNLGDRALCHPGRLCKLRHIHMRVDANRVEHVPFGMIKAKSRRMFDGDFFESIVFIHDPDEEIHDLIACFVPVHENIVYYLNYKVKRNYGAKD